MSSLAGKMSPFLSEFYVSNYGMSDSVRRSYGVMRSRIATYCEDLRLCELGRSVCFSERMTSAFDAVAFVIFRGAESKVAKPNTRRVIACVSKELSFRNFFPCPDPYKMCHEPVRMPLNEQKPITFWVTITCPYLALSRFFGLALNTLIKRRPTSVATKSRELRGGQMFGFFDSYHLILIHQGGR